MVPADSRRITRVPRYSGVRAALSRFVYGIVTLCDAPFQTLLLPTEVHRARSYNPCGAWTPQVWAGPRSLATTGGFIELFSLPRGTKMFQFPRFASVHIRTDSHPSGGWVVPFGNPRVKGYVRLTGAYRSLSRPSSPP